MANLIECYKISVYNYYATCIFTVNHIATFITYILNMLNKCSYLDVVELVITLTCI